jgi:hypothetical protein
MGAFSKKSMKRLWNCGAHDWNRTSDLLLTKEVLYRLSYVSLYLCRPP